jgi:hypothetical protein
VRDVELLQLPEPRHLLRQRAGDLVEADIEHRELPQASDLGRQAGVQPVVDEQELVEGAGHVGDAGREAAAEGVVREDERGDRRVADVVRDPEAEAVVVEEDGVERAVEERGGNPALELVESQVEEPERGHVEHDVRELADEAVVAEVELVEEAEVAEGSREHAAEAVGAEVEQREVGEEAQLGREVPRDVAVVEVDAGDREDARVGGERRAEDTRVVADVRAGPVGGEVPRVGEDGVALPRLQGYVAVPDAPAREAPGGVHLHRRRPGEFFTPSVAGEVQRRSPAAAGTCGGGEDGEQE